MKRKHFISLGTLVAVSFLPSFVVRQHDAALAYAQQRTVDQDRQALIALENEWLNGEHNAAALERILASDFVHPVATGDFLTKAQHIYYSTKYLPPANLKQRFDNLSVRLYGDVGIVNGIVITSDEHAKDVDRTIFTDVFAYRDGRWQAINGQENRVEKRLNLAAREVTHTLLMLYKKHRRVRQNSGKSDFHSCKQSTYS